MGRRTRVQALIDFATFPVRALVALGGRDRWGMSAIARDRFEYAAREVQGQCLDIGCGRHDRFVREYLGGAGVGVDVFPYEGLDREQILEDMTSLPFDDRSFDTVTFLANFNHIPEPLRDSELADAMRVLRPGGNVIVTMGNPLAELAVHRLLALYDRHLGTSHDVDSERGMGADETYYVLDSEIRRRLTDAGFVGLRKRRFWTQWGLNHLLVGYRPGTGSSATAQPRSSAALPTDH